MDPRFSARVPSPNDTENVPTATALYPTATLPRAEASALLPTAVPKSPADDEFSPMDSERSPLETAFRPTATPPRLALA
ncbi:hypothetical protein G6F66_015446 [Rhizopus arrhizus]|nr:hypothetical protein G6F66_015446 [Rhizopus arrhizus]